MNENRKKIPVSAKKTINIFPQSMESRKWLVAAILIPLLAAFIPVMFNYVRDSPDTTVVSDDYSRQIKNSRDILKALYETDYQYLYQNLSPLAQKTISFTDLEKLTNVMTSQYITGPKIHRFDSATPSGSEDLVIEFTGEFDSESNLREILTFKKTGNNWGLWHINLVNEGWPIINTTGPYAEESALKTIKSANQKTVHTKIHGYLEADGKYQLLVLIFFTQKEPVM